MPRISDETIPRKTPYGSRFGVACSGTIGAHETKERGLPGSRDWMAFRSEKRPKLGGRRSEVKGRARPGDPKMGPRPTGLSRFAQTNLVFCISRQTIDLGHSHNPPQPGEPPVNHHVR